MKRGKWSVQVDQYRLVELEDGVVPVLVPDDPIKTLRSAASDEFRTSSVDELREAALYEGREQGVRNRS